MTEARTTSCHATAIGNTANSSPHPLPLTVGQLANCPTVEAPTPTPQPSAIDLRPSPLDSPLPPLRALCELRVPSCCRQPHRAGPPPDSEARPNPPPTRDLSPFGRLLDNLPTAQQLTNRRSAQRRVRLPAFFYCLFGLCAVVKLRTTRTSAQSASLLPPQPAILATDGQPASHHTTLSPPPDCWTIGKLSNS